MWRTNYKPDREYARFIKIKCDTLAPATDFLSYGSTHPAPRLPSALDVIYSTSIVKPLDKLPDARKHCTRNTNWRARHKLKQLKQNDDCPSQTVQSSVLAGPKILAGGRPPTEKCALQSVVNCQYSKTLGASHNDDCCSCARLVL